MPASGSPTKPLARVVARDPAGAAWTRRPCGGRGSGRASPRSAPRSARGSSARTGPPGSGRRSAASSTAAREPLHELVVDRLVDDRRAERGAALARGAEAAEQRALDGEVEVGVRHHDERVLAAQLEAGRLAVAAGELADPRADRRRPGEADLVDEPLVERALEALEGRRAVATAPGSARRRAGRPR